jgi:hypothetical protein
MKKLKHTKLTPAITLLAVLIFFFTQQANAQLQANPDSPFIKPVVDPAKPVATVITQQSSVPKIPKFKYDSTFSPRKATIRSAIIPGWGQVYNHQIWKLPFVYAAVGITAGIFVYNINGYKGLRNTYILITDNNAGNDSLVPFKYKNIANSPNTVKAYRDEFRRNVDYSVLAFLVAWGLNVVDATVSSQLRQFDVTDDLSLQLRPTVSPTGTVGFGLVMNFK